MAALLYSLDPVHLALLFSVGLLGVLIAFTVWVIRWAERGEPEP